MFGYSMGIIIIIIFSSCVIIKTQWSWFQTLPVSVSAIIFIMYIVGLFHNLTLGIVVVGIFAVICLGFLFVNKNVILTLYTQEFKLVLVIFLVIYVFQIWAKATHGDEFSHWALTVSEMFSKNVLGNTSIAATRFKEYPPATALLEYFFVKLDGKFSYANHFRGMNIFTVSFLLPLASNIKNKISQKWITAIVLLIPTVFFYPYTESLVDCVLGVLAADILYVYFNTDMQKRYKYIAICTFSAICVLTKQSGIALVMIAVAIMAIDAIVMKKRKSLLFPIAGLMAGIAAKASWSITLHIEKSIAVFNVDNITLRAVLDLIRNFGENEKQILFKFINDFIAVDPSLGFVKLSYVAWCMALVIAGIAIFKTGAMGKKQIITLEISMISAFIGYSFYLLLMYFFTWEQALDEGSFYRYLGTCMLAFVLFVSVLALRNYKNNENYKYIFIGILLLCRLEWLKLLRNPIEAIITFIK